jgi:plasmid stabilization system protein ParE
MKFLPKMTIKLSKQFQLDLISQVHFIYKDKPQAALKFRKDIIKNLRKDLKHLFCLKNLFILIMKLLEIMFLKAILVFMKLMSNKMS